MRSRHAWIVAVLGLAAIALIAWDTLPSRAPKARGVASNRPLPPFAVPLATSHRRCDGGPCDANVAPRARSGARGKRPACEVRARDILNSCALAESGPVALAFVTARSKRCVEQVEIMDRLRPHFPAVRLAAVAVGGDLDGLNRIIRRRGLTLPVGYDHDGAVASLYAVAACPTITFVRRGGRVQGTSLELLGEAALADRLRALEG